MEKIKKLLDAFPKWSKILLLVIVVVLGGTKLLSGVSSDVIRFINHQKTKNANLKIISATNSYTYKKDDVISVEDFEIVGEFDNGAKIKMNTSDFEIDKNRIDYCGDTTIVKITYKKADKVFCEAEVKNERERVTGFSCGTPNVNNVEAVLYSNGELCFEGAGDIAKYDDYLYPWVVYANENKKEEDVVQILSVSFEEGITPVNMDAMFKGLHTLEYVSDLPASVQSIDCTFAECSALKTGALWSKCTDLKNIRSAYYGCYNLTSLEPIPETVIYADYACADCDSLEHAPDMENAVNLISMVGMFDGCEKLSVVKNIAPYATTINAMFRNCVNLKQMPEIPDTVIYMEETFSGALSLTIPSVIPKNVYNVKECFLNCGMLSGFLWIDGEPEEYDGFLEGAVTTSSLEIDGNSRMMDVLANTNQNKGLITIAGRPVNPDMITRESAIPEQVEIEEDAQTQSAPVEDGEENATAESTPEDNADKSTTRLLNNRAWEALLRV